jgi:competence protein ComEA
MSILVLALVGALFGAPAMAETHIHVQVSGAVKHPGTLTLLVGARAAEAIAGAGGPRKDAALMAVNLTRVLADGDECHVPTRSEAVPPPAAHGKPHATSHGNVRYHKSAGHVVHLNSATQADLESLPGVGPGTAVAILQLKARLGRFHSVDDLREVRGFGRKRLERVRSLLVVD